MRPTAVTIPGIILILRPVQLSHEIDGYRWARSMKIRRYLIQPKGHEIKV